MSVTNMLEGGFIKMKLNMDISFSVFRLNMVKSTTPVIGDKP